VADCGPIDLLCKTKNGFTGAVTGVVESGFEKICHAIADAGSAVLKAVSDAFLATSSIDLQHAGIDRVLVVTTGIGMGLAVLLLLGQVIRAGASLRPDILAHAVVGVFKAGLATATVFAVTTALLAAADGLSASIMNATFGSTQAFSERFGKAVTFSGIGTGNPAAPVALLLIFGVVAAAVGVVLFAEMLFRHAAVVALVATSPIAASGLIARSTTDWWRKLVSAGVQAIFLKPLIVLIFAIGFGLAGTGTGVLNVLAGLTVLAIAAFAWYVLARFCTWTSAHVAEAGGAAAFVGGYLGAEARRIPGRVMSAQASGSSSEAGRATMARNNAIIDGGMASGSGAAGAAAGPVGMAAAGGAAAVGAAADHLKSGMDRMAPGEGTAPPLPTADGPSSSPPPFHPPSPPPGAGEPPQAQE
jgi:hypothetical protein